MTRVLARDLDYLAAGIHGRRGRVAEADRLDGLCQLRTIPDLSRAIFPTAELHSSVEFQRRSAEALLTEFSRAARHLDQPGEALLNWMLVRFQVENIKVLLRAFLDHIPLGEVRKYLVALPEELALDTAALLSAGTLEKFVDHLPLTLPRRALCGALGRYRDQARPFFLEAALDQCFFAELLARAGRLSREDREVVLPLIEQEANMFLLMLVVRGRFGYGLPPELLLPLHIHSRRLARGRFKAMLTTPDLHMAARLAVGRAIDDLPAEAGSSETARELEAAELEARTWQRLLRLAQRAFRRSHMGLGAVIGYAVIRRVEVMNLVTLSEGIRAGIAPDVIRARMIPRHEREVADV